MPDLRARSNVEIIDAAFQLYSRNYSLYLALGLFGSLPALFSMFSTGARQQFVATHFGLFIGGFIVALVCTLVAGCAYITLTDDLYHDRTGDLGQAITRAVSRAGSVFVVALMTWIVVAIGFVLLLIPGIILLFRLCLVVVVATLEPQVGHSDAIYRSFRLTKGHALKLLGMGCMLFVILLLVVIIEQLFRVLPGVFGIVLGYVAAASLNPLLSVIATIFYYDLRIRNEGYDIQAIAGDMAPAAS